MDISQVRYEPWKAVRTLGEGSYGSVFEIQREEFGELYKAALKVISIPQNDGEIISNRADGMTDQSMADYYHSVVIEMTHELALLSKLKGATNIVGYEDHKIVQHPDGIGWDIYIRMELLTSLTAVSAKYDFSRNQVVKIGIDICNALMLCEKNNILHRDIKPDNIFISRHGDYKLGDFGIARTAAQTAANMSTKGTPNYMAPEVYKGMNYDATVDIYSLGIVLYQMMNGKRLPFIPASVTLSARESALGRRMSGESFPDPEMADGEFTRVILKACAYDPKARYANAYQMKKDLEKLIEGVHVAPINADAISGEDVYTDAQDERTQDGNNQGDRAKNAYVRQGGFSEDRQANGRFGSYAGNNRQGGGQYSGQKASDFGYDATAGYMQQNENADMNDRSFISFESVPPSVAANPSDAGEYDFTVRGDSGNIRSGGSGGHNGNVPGRRKFYIEIAGGMAAVVVLVLIMFIAVRSLISPKPTVTPPLPDSGAETVSTESGSGFTPPESSGSDSNVAEEKPATGLSDSLDDYTFELDGAVMKLPVDYKEFTAHGWAFRSYDDSITEDSLLTAQRSNFFYMTNGDARIDVQIYNPSGDTRPIRDCKIGSVRVVKEEGLSFKIAGGMEPGVSAEDVLAKFGTPANNQTGTDYQTIRYMTGQYSSEGETEFYFRKEHSANNYISISYMPLDTIDAGEVPESRPAYLDTYVAPAALSDDPTQTIFQLGGDLYQLPCTIDAFLDNGWTISSKSVDAIASGNYELLAMKLSKDKCSISLSLMNFDGRAAKAENCAVISVAFSTSFEADDMPGDYAVFSGGIKLGSSLEEYTAALSSFEVSTSGSTTDFTYSTEDFSKSLYYSLSYGSYKNNQAMLENHNWDY